MPNDPPILAAQKLPGPNTGDVAPPKEGQKPSSPRLSNVGSPARKHRFQSLTILNNWWVVELAAGSFSIVCVATIVAVFLHFDGKPLSAWHSALGPNTVISILANVAKPPMLLPVAECTSQTKWLQFQKARPLKLVQLLDDASRGPHGAVQPPFPVEAMTAWFGAITTLAALGFDPFVQQVLSMNPQETLLTTTTNANARVPVARSFDTGSEPMAYWPQDIFHTGDFHETVNSPSDLLSSVASTTVRWTTLPNAHHQHAASVASCHWASAHHARTCCRASSPTATAPCAVYYAGQCFDGCLVYIRYGEGKVYAHNTLQQLCNGGPGCERIYSGPILLIKFVEHFQTGPGTPLTACDCSLRWCAGKRGREPRSPIPPTRPSTRSNGNSSTRTSGSGSHYGRTRT